LIQCVGINNELFPPLTACPICDARWLFMLRVRVVPVFAVGLSSESTSKFKSLKIEWWAHKDSNLGPAD
jgi:hypothetical protein